MAGMIAVVASVALFAAPAAWASGDVVTTAANVNFNGVVDASPQCSDATSITINWGPGQGTSTGTYRTDFEVQGNHTYSSPGSYAGTVTFSGGSSGNCTPSTPDTFTANVGATPQFPQCPQVGADVGCQFLIDITPGGTTVLQDTTQGPYENAEDALIGLKNDSSSPISSIPISVPGSDVFGFENDGLCDPGFGPVPTDCQQLTLNSGGTPAAGAACDPSAGACATPQPAGQPAPDAGAYTGTTRNGYEGPGTFYTNVSTDSSSGRVNFSPAVPPGGTTYFSLEEPPSANAINVSATPTGVGLTAPPTVTATSAAFTGIVNPNGAATTAQFQFNLDGKYGKLASIIRSTATQNVGGDFADHVVTATVTGLAPNAVYHVRLVATNKNGQTVGTNVTFKTKSAAAPGAPTLGRTFNIAPVSGVVLVKLHGFFQPITQVRQFPKNTLFDALGGTLRLTTAASGHPASDAAAKGKGKKGKGKTQTGTFGGAVFKITQAHNGLATVTLVENAFKGGPSFKKCGGKASDASAASSRTLQLLRSSAKGKFATKGKYAAATVRGTKWTTADRCNGTQVHVNSGSVAVTDFHLHKTVVLHGGQTYLAKKP
jgi:hypothetical protein